MSGRTSCISSRALCFVYGGLTLFACPFHDILLHFARLLIYWSFPISLVTTLGIVITSSSSPYLDISVRVVSPIFRYVYASSYTGSPIRIPPVLCLLTAPRSSFAVRRVLLRLLVPRHPLTALSSLTFFSSTLFYLLFKDLFS